jgi:hypothetical protein
MKASPYVAERRISERKTKFVSSVPLLKGMGRYAQNHSKIDSKSFKQTVVDFRNDFLLILRPQADQGLHGLATLKIIPVIHSSPQKKATTGVCLRSLWLFVRPSCRWGRRPVGRAD